MRFRIGEKDNPRGDFLIFKTKKLNDEKWHKVKISRLNEQTLLIIDDSEPLYHVHHEARPDGFDLYFGSHSNDVNLVKTENLLLFGGFPDHIQTYDLSHGTALFEQRFNGFIRNVRAINCSSSSMMNLYVTASSNLRYINNFDACTSSPCLNGGVCLIVDDINNYKCDCSYVNYDGNNCEICKILNQKIFILFSQIFILF